MTTGVLVMAYGTASGPDDIERYYTDIRGGRPPAPEHLAELRERYERIGNRFPLLETTAQVAAGVEASLNERAGDPGAFRAYLGMKHSEPRIREGVVQMRDDGIERAVGLVMAPHWARMSVDSYVDRVEKAVAEDGGPSFTFVPHWYGHPAFLEFLCSRVVSALGRLPAAERDRAAVVFSAHSLPVWTLDDGTRRCLRCDAAVCEKRCEYAFQLQDTANRVAERLDLPNDVFVGWQSAGRTEDPWWGPAIEEVIPDLAARGYPAVVVCSAGFAADHLETLYDLDVEASRVAADGGVRFVRTEMPNADPRFVEALAQVVLDHLKEAS
jgi:ferrochelatase